MLTAFQVDEYKSVYPYDWLTDFNFLEQSYLPPIEAFYSTLKGVGINEQQYHDLTELWVKEGFRTMKDFLIYYNNKDVGPFLVAVEKMFNIFREKGIDMFKSDNISLPGLALVRMFQQIPPDKIFQVYDEKIGT